MQEHPADSSPKDPGRCTPPRSSIRGRLSAGSPPPASAAGSRSRARSDEGFRCRRAGPRDAPPVLREGRPPARSLALASWNHVGSTPESVSSSPASEENGTTRPSAAPFVFGDVRDDPVDPRSERGPALEALDAFDHGEPSLLHDLLGRGVRRHVHPRLGNSARLARTGQGRPDPQPSKKGLDDRLYRPDVSSIEDPNERLVGSPQDLLFVDRQQLAILHDQSAVDKDVAHRAPMRCEG